MLKKTKLSDALSDILAGIIATILKGFFLTVGIILAFKLFY